MTDTTPALLVEGDTILGARDGKPWTVAAVETGVAVHLEHGDRRVRVELGQLPPKVTLVATAAQAEEMALALVQVRLGGQVEAVQKDGPWDVPLTFLDPGQLLAHLYLFHMGGLSKEVPAVYPDGPLAELERLHEEAHALTPPVPHRHLESFYRDLTSQS